MGGFAVPVAVGLLGVLLLLGLGDSKARSKAFCELLKFICSRLSGKVITDIGLLDGGKGDKKNRRRSQSDYEDDFKLGTSAGQLRKSMDASGLSSMNPKM